MSEGNSNIGFMWGMLVFATIMACGGIVYGFTRSQVASECRRDGFVWIDGAKYTCTKVSPG